MSLELQEIQWNTAWREKYIVALEQKLEFLIRYVEILGDNFVSENNKPENVKEPVIFGNSVTAKTMYDLRSYQIEALEMEHRIYYEKKVLEDWKSQVEKTTVDAEAHNLKLSNENFSRVFAIAAKNSYDHKRLEKLINNYNAEETHTP